MDDRNTIFFAPTGADRPAFSLSRLAPLQTPVILSLSERRRRPLATRAVGVVLIAWM
jgi:hypothetical protein